MIINSYLKQS